MSGTGGAALIWAPFPDPEAARSALAVLLNEKLVACGNLLPGVESTFAWQGAHAKSDECGALLKTTAASLGPAMERLATLHPYETPSITGWVVHADAGTLAWLETETRR